MFVKLTQHGGLPVWVHADAIAAMSRAIFYMGETEHEVTRVMSLVGEYYWEVIETPEQIMALIREADFWK